MYSVNVNLVVKDEKLSRIRREEEEEVKALEDQLESRKKRLLSEMLNQGC